MNRYRNLNKIEFVVTYACTGKCKHCSEGDHKSKGKSIDPVLAAKIVKRVASLYDIKTVMAFGGEPLLYADAVFEIMSAATEMGVQTRQVITNGYFSNDTEYICFVAKKLKSCGVNDLLLSVDAFHQETIPVSAVEFFAEQALINGINIRLQPAWLVSCEDDNPYNLKTREILKNFKSQGIRISDGNIIFPEGNAKIYLSEYFKTNIPQNPYTEDLNDIKCLSIEPDGTVIGGNIYRQDVIEILQGGD